MVIFTRHALLKLQQREIRKEFVLETLALPDDIKTSQGNRQAAFRKFGRLHLKVIFKREGKNLIVITQHWVTNV